MTTCSSAFPCPSFCTTTRIPWPFISAIGVERLIETAQEDLALLPQEKIQAVGFVLDADNQKPPAQRLLALEAAVNYPELLQGAQAFVDGLDLAALTVQDRKEFNKPAGRHKSTVGSVASVLRPGKSVQVSIQDNRWVDARTVRTVERLRAFRQFLLELLELPAD